MMDLGLSLGPLGLGHTTWITTISTLVSQGLNQLHSVHQPNQLNTSLKAVPWKYLRKCISWVLLGVYLYQLHLAILHKLPDPMIPNVDVLCPCMID